MTNASYYGLQSSRMKQSVHLLQQRMYRTKVVHKNKTHFIIFGKKIKNKVTEIT